MAAGQKIITPHLNDMITNKEKIKQVIEIIKFILTTDDPDIIKPSLESVIETLEDVIS